MPTEFCPTSIFALPRKLSYVHVIENNSSEKMNHFKCFNNRKKGKKKAR